MSAFVVISADFVKTGGQDRACYALADRLARKGRPTELVAHRVDTELATKTISHRVVLPLGSYFLGEYLLDRAGRRVASARQAQEAGAIVVTNGGNCRWFDVNWVHYVHAAYQPSPGRGVFRKVKNTLAARRWRRTERQRIAGARLVIANSELTRRHCIELLGVEEHRIHTVYYGVDPGEFRPASDSESSEIRSRLGLAADRPLVAFVGSLGDARKGFAVLFDAWRRFISRSVPDAMLLVIGRGAEVQLWRDRVRSESLDQSVGFLGFRDDVPDILRAADMLVAPAEYEAYGLGVHEALCCGLPSIVSASAGIAERFPKSLDALLLQDRTSAAELAERMQNVLKHPGEFRNDVRPFSEALRSRTWDQMADDIENLATREAR